MLFTAWATWRAIPTAAALSAALSALVFADGWFDVTTAPPDYVHWSLLSAAALEWPFALVCAYVAVRGFRPDASAVGSISGPAGEGSVTTATRK